MSRKCIQKSHPTPENMPADILGDDCALGVQSTDDFCSQYENFINWIFDSCSHSNKYSKKNQLRKRCERIRDFYSKWISFVTKKHVHKYFHLHLSPYPTS